MALILFLLYLSDIISSLSGVLFILGALTILLSVILYDNGLVDVTKEQAFRGLKYGLATMLISLLIPSSNFIKCSIAYLSVSELSKVEAVNEIGTKSVKLLNSYLDKELKEIEEQSKQSDK